MLLCVSDQHVSRVWSDLTPARSPGRPPTPPPHRARLREPHPRDMHSTLSAQSALSADSGNVRDFGDAASSGKTRSVDYPLPNRRLLSAFYYLSKVSSLLIPTRNFNFNSARRFVGVSLTLNMLSISNS